MAYVSEGYQGVEAISYTPDQSPPALKYTYATNMNARGMYLNSIGTVLYLANYNNGVYIFDLGGSPWIAPKASCQPIFAASVYYPQDICVNQPETQIFVADASSGFLAISNNGGAFTTFTTLGTLAVPGSADSPRSRLHQPPCLHSLVRQGFADCQFCKQFAAFAVRQLPGPAGKPGHPRRDLGQVRLHCRRQHGGDQSEHIDRLLHAGLSAVLLGHFLVRASEVARPT